MSSSAEKFDPSRDPFSVTFEALSKTEPSWSGGFKCITINGQNALRYVQTSEMNWTDYYNFILGQADFSSAKIAEVIIYDVMMVGIRRRFFSEALVGPLKEKFMRATIDKNVNSILKKVARPEKAADITMHITGEPSPSLTVAKTNQAFQILFETEAASIDIRRIVNAAKNATNPQVTKKLVEEVFSYVLPNTESGADEEMTEAIFALLQKKFSVGEVLSIVRKAYPDEFSSLEIMKRFIPLFLGGCRRWTLQLIC
jgi:hypothetical protein